MGHRGTYESLHPGEGLFSSRGLVFILIVLVSLCGHIHFIDIPTRSLAGKEMPPKPDDAFMSKH